MPQVRPALPTEKDLVDGFYASEGRTVRVESGEQWVLALEDGKVVGVLRLCLEESHQVLRTVQVTESLRRMLDLVPPLLQPRPCFCLPYSHLIRFYGRIGFVPIPTPKAPEHLQTRLAGYLAKGEDMLVMRRD
jgi:hypothetical protein